MLRHGVGFSETADLMAVWGDQRDGQICIWRGGQEFRMT